MVTDRLSTLAAFGLIEEGGVGRSIGGRAPRLVRFRSESARILVANIDGETIGVGLADLQGRLIHEHYEDSTSPHPRKSLFERLETLFSWSLSQKDAPLWAIALGVPGTVEKNSVKRLAIPSSLRCRPGTKPCYWNV